MTEMNALKVKDIVFNLIMMRMKKITIALAAALAVFSACQKTPALPAVQFDQTNYILPAEDGVTVKVVSDKPLTADVEFTVSGTAVKDKDYKISVEDKVSFTDSYEAAIVIEPLDNLEGKNIVLELKGAADGSFTLGGNAKATVVITPKEKIYCSFTKQGTRLSGTADRVVSVKLFGAESKDKFVASGEIKIPFTISGTAKEGTDFEVVGGEHFLVAASGSKVASVTLKSKYETAPETLPTLTLSLPEADGRFLAGVNKDINVVFGGVLTFQEIAGKWAYSSFPLKDDPEADDIGTFEMLMDEAGDTWENNVPCKNTASDIIEFKSEDGVNKLAVSGTGDIFDYLADAEVTKIESCPYTWYYYSPASPWENSVKLTLAKVNYDFAKTSADYKEGTVIINLSDDGETLDLVIPASSYDPVKGDYFKGIRSAYEGVVWTMYIDSGYWDCYYVFKKVND